MSPHWTFQRESLNRCSLMHRDDHFVTLKILTCEATKAISGAEQRSDELQILTKIMVARPLHHGFKHSLALNDSFEFTRPHGTHLCLVTEVLGFSLDYLRKVRDDGDYCLRVSIVKRVAKQVLCGLEYLHDECGVVHAGKFFLAHL